MFLRKKKNENVSYEEKSLKVLNYVVKKDYLMALQELDSYFDPKAEADWYTKGNILTNLNRISEALTCYDKAIKIDPAYVKAWYRKGWAHFSKREYREAYSSFRKCADTENRKVTKYNSGPWRPAALVSATITLMTEKDHSTVDELIDLLLYDYDVLLANGLITSETYPPKQSITDGSFSDYLLENYNVLLNSLEPKVAVEFKR
jgi:tetratricopeptide (TPR) repeat protein